MPVSETDSQQIGLGILQRVAVREKAQLHKEFLTRLHQLPQAQEIILCGSMALHGVYLQKRWSKDLDFEAPTDIAWGFQEIAAQAGLNISLREGWEGQQHPLNAVPYVLSSPSAFYPEVVIGVEIFACASRFLAPERRDLTAASGETVSVFVKSLPEMMGAKIGCLYQRHKAIDFVDLWFGLASDPFLLLEVKDLLQSGLCEAGNFTPPRVIDPDFLLHRLARLEESWHEALSIYLTQVPDFPQVQEDMRRWLPFFSTTSKTKGGTV
jgi:hypothetical protein